MPDEPAVLVPLTPVRCAPEALDEESRAYLAAQRESPAGVLDSRGTWSKFWAFVGAGLVVAALLIAMTAGGVSPPEPAMKWVLAGLAGLGGLVLAGAAHTLSRRRQDGYLGHFLFTEGAYLWEVDPHQVQFTPIHTMQGARGVHHHYNGGYTHTQVSLTAPEGSLSFSINGKPKAEELIQFLNLCAKLSADPGDLGQIAKSDPAARGAVALAILRDRTAELKLEGLVPVPRPRDTGMAPPSRRRTIMVVALLAGMGLGHAVLPEIQRYLAEERMIAQVRRSSEHDVITPQAYLGLYPKGRHVLEARNARDDHRWAVAKRDATSKKSPSALRAYLASAENTRHRKEAQELIGRFYDEAIARVRSLAEGKGDRKLFDALLALIEGLKTRPRPVVTIGFAATNEPLPATQAQASEKQAYGFYQREWKADMDRMERGTAARSAILPVGDAFLPEQVRLRERVIADRLAAATAKVLSADIIAFEAARGTEPPQIKIAYHTAPSGTLYSFVRTTQNQLGTTRTFRGLLRGYSIGWKLAIQPAGSSRAFPHELASRPAQSLRYREALGDPVWAPYAIMVYSAFHDFSSELIKGFGLVPPPAPNSFSFRDATGTTEAMSSPLPSPLPVNRNKALEEALRKLREQGRNKAAKGGK